MDYTINYKEEAYPDLLIQCAHDTHHDFFENPDPMKIEIQQGLQGQKGGSKRKGSPEEISSDTEKRIRESIDLSSGELKRKISAEDGEDKKKQKIDEEMVEEMVEESMNDVDAKEFDHPSDYDFSNDTPYKDDTLVVSLEEWSYYLDLDNDIYSFVSVDKMCDDSCSILPTSMLDSQRNVREIESIDKVSQSFIMGDATPMKIDERFAIEQGGGDRIRRTRALRPELRKNIEKYQSLLKTIFKKIQTWDVFGISINNPDFSLEEKDKYLELNAVNSHGGISDDKITTFYQWFKTNYDGAGQGSRKPMILKEIEEVINKYQREGREVDSRLIHFTFYTLLNNHLDEEPNEAIMEKELEKLFLLVKNFSKYTSLPSDIMSNYLTVKINIDAFIKKKWNKYRSSFPSLESYFGKGKRATLSDQDRKEIDTFKRVVMNGWLSSIDLKDDALQSVWAKNEFKKIKENKSITDAGIRDDFLKGEFNITGKQGFFGLNSTMNEGRRPTQKGVESKLLEISRKAYSSPNQSFGNNASSTKFYSSDGPWDRLKPKLASYIMDKKMNYNCNGPNVGDPASTCPDLLAAKPGRNLKITLRVNDRNKIVFTMNGFIPHNLTKCLMGYEIMYEGKTLKMDNYPVNTINSMGKKVDLSHFL